MSTNYMCMVSPWMANGTLANYVSSDHYSLDKDCNRLVSNSLVLDRLALRSECLDRTQLCEISCGLLYLHSQKVVHGDIHAVRALDTLVLRTLTNLRSRPTFSSTSKVALRWPILVLRLWGMSLLVDYLRWEVLEVTSGTWHRNESARPVQTHDARLLRTCTRSLVSVFL
jgi:serine/threonine protein kinase